MDPHPPQCAAPPPNQRQASGTCALRLKRFEIFSTTESPGQALKDVDSDDRSARSDLHRPPTRERRISLRSVDYGATVADLFSLAPSDQGSSSSRSASPTPRATAAAAQCLASLRSKTLLDLKFMREFSLVKRRPVEERNLSRLSANSVYRMRMAQMELETQARMLHRVTVSTESRGNNSLGSKSALEPTTVQPPTGSKADDETRVPSQINALGRPPLRHLTLVPKQTTTANASDGSAYFPTLWKPDIDAKAFTKYRQSNAQTNPTAKSPRTACVPDKTAPAITNSAPRGLQGRRLVNAAATTTGGLIISDGLSEFDLRKCHPTPVVTAQHGFLHEQDIKRLIEETGYDRTELYAIWTRFKALCSIARSPKGIDKETFRRGTPQLSLEDQFFVDRVFDILDADGSGILEWQEFVDVLSALERGDAVKRVDFLFRVYDLNGNGTILRSEVMQFFLASLLVPPTDDLVEVAKHFIDKIFESVGCQDRESMRVQDVIKYVHDHPSSDIYSLFGRTMVTKHTTRVKWEVSDPSPSRQIK